MYFPPSRSIRSRSSGWRAGSGPPVTIPIGDAFTRSSRDMRPALLCGSCVPTTLLWYNLRHVVSATHGDCLPSKAQKHIANARGNLSCSETRPRATMRLSDLEYVDEQIPDAGMGERASTLWWSKKQTGARVSPLLLLRRGFRFALEYRVAVRYGPGRIHFPTRSGLRFQWWEGGK